MRSAAGCLGQGSILAVTSHAERTSPVLRGKWVLENILGAPVPPPPPDVPPLKETAAGEKPRTMRQQMAEHRTESGVRGVPQGDGPDRAGAGEFRRGGRVAFARWGRVIDASGQLADGTKVDGVVSLRKALTASPDLFARTFTEKLLTYALGRGLTYHDMPVVRSIVREAARSDYRFSAIVLGIVRSTPFQMRQRAGTGIGAPGRWSSLVMFLAKKKLNRRALLRGAGAAIALPLLDAMIPAFAPRAWAASLTPRRFGVTYFPNGHIMQEFTPATVGTGFAFTPILKPLEPFRDSLLVLTNFTRSHAGSQVGDHAVSAAGFLTGVWPKRTEAEDVLANTSIDQIVAQQIGQETPLPSLELATEDFTGYVGACSPGFSCAYMNTISWRTPQQSAADGDQSARRV